MIDRGKYLWLSDTHTKIIDRYKLLSVILDQKPRAVFHTGDISEGFAFLSDLEFIGKRIGRPFYFVLGNHEVWGSSFAKIHAGVRSLCDRYKNLVWMTEGGIIQLNDEACLIGADGWYSAEIGNPEYIKYTGDWFFIEDFKKLSSMKERIAKFRELAIQSAELLGIRLEQALQNYKTIYLLSHVPAWAEAHRPNGWFGEKFYEPYNTNLILGKTLEKIMSNYKKRHLICLMGHTHCPVQIHVQRNIECRVSRGSYHKISEEEIIYI